MPRRTRKRVVKDDIPDHNTHGQYLKDVVYGANDGIITTFAVVASVAGAGLNSYLILLLGFAALLADGFSMAASNYLGSKSEQEFFVRERNTEERELLERPEEEQSEMRGILLKKGYKGEDVTELQRLLFKNKSFWLEIMLREELGVAVEGEAEHPMKRAFATFVAFTVAGSVPLIPYFFLSQQVDTFTSAAVFAGIALFIVGALRAQFTGRSSIASGFEMLCVGGVAAFIAYGMGYTMSVIFGIPRV